MFFDLVSYFTFVSCCIYLISSILYHNHIIHNISDELSIFVAAFVFSFKNEHQHIQVSDLGHSICTFYNPLGLFYV
jgi:hypothetical protein